MSTIDVIEIWGAPGARAIATRIAAAMDSPPVEDWGDRGWGTYEGDWTARALVTPHREPGDGGHVIIVEHRYAGEPEDAFLAALHAVTDRIFDHLAGATRWGLWVDSDDEPGYPHRYRPAGGVEASRGSEPDRPLDG